MRVVLEAECGVVVEPIRYDYVDAVSFLLPGPLRKLPVDRVAYKLAAIKSAYPTAEVSVIAHSFGTYVVGRLLKRDPFLRIHRMILCGAVLPTTFDWPSVGHKIAENKIVNECGVRDVWPLLAAGVTWGYGASGTFGFSGPKVRDRFHDTGHSGYFNREFISSHWVPYIREGTIRGTDFEVDRPPVPWWQSMLAWGAPRMAAFILLLALVAWFVLRPPSSLAHGTVRDGANHGAPMPGVRVLFYGLRDGQQFETTSSRDGAFQQRLPVPTGAGVSFRADAQDGRDVLDILHTEQHEEIIFKEKR